MIGVCFVTAKPFVYSQGATRFVRDGVCRAFFFSRGIAYINILVRQYTIVGLYGDFSGARVLVYNLARARVHAVL